MVVGMQLFGGAITSLFVSDPEIIALGANGLKVTSLFYLALGMIYVCRGILNGAGDAMFPLISGIAEMTGRVIFPALLCSLPFLGAWGLWVSTGVTWTIVGCTALVRYITKYSKSTL